MAKPRKAAGGGPIILGAGIMAVELPTAFPYFAGLVAIVESPSSTLLDVLLVLLYNVVFIGPLLIVLALTVIGGSAGERFARSARAKLDRLAPTVAPVALGLIGVALLTIGVSGLR